MEVKELDTNWFVGETEEYACPICLGVLRNAMQAIVGAQCGHRYCEVCVKDIFEGEGTPCPVCRVNVKKSNLHPDVAFRRKISELRVRCHVDPDKCNATGQFGKGEWWEQHEKVCFANTEPCVMCSQRVLKSAMRAHLAECKELEINCPFACKHTCKRKDMQVHEEKCKLTRGPDTVARCQFAALGCRFEAKRSAVKDIEDHMKAETTKHLEMMLGEAQEKEKIYLMEYVLLSQEVHSSGKYTMADGTNVWFQISPATSPEHKGFYSLFLYFDKARYFSYRATAWVVKPDAIQERAADFLAKAHDLMHNALGFIQFLKVEPGTLVKLEVSDIKVWAHSKQNSFKPVPFLLKQLEDSQQQLSVVQQQQQQQQQQQKQQQHEIKDLQQQLKDLQRQLTQKDQKEDSQQQLSDVQQQQQQQQQQQKQQQQEIKDLQQQLKDLQRQLTQKDKQGKRGKAEKTEPEEEPSSKRTRHQRR
eukprot:g8953.t1